MPPYYPGMSTRRAQAVAPPGSWILDPFGNDPFAILELARAGYRVLVTSNNPISAFIMEVLASAPSTQEWGDALLALSDLRTSEDQRLEDFINSFYQIPCTNCHHMVELQSIIWNEDQSDPVAVLLDCPQCGLSGEQSFSLEMRSQLKSLPSYPMHRAMALELVAGPNDELRPLMEDVVKYYSPRALILLQILLNRINSPELSPRQRTLLQALLLTTADQVNQLWAYPLGKNRPKQLLRPPTYQELNLWQALLHSQEIWQAQTEPAALKHWPGLPSQQGGISLFRGRLRELDPLPDPKVFSLVHISLPRRNQAYWNLSGLWTGWLWGREAVNPLRHSLLRQRYDWTWHAKALEKVLTQLKRLVLPQTPALIQIGEVDIMFLMAGILSAQDSGLKLAGFALDGGETTLQIRWQVDLSPEKPAAASDLSAKAREAAMDFLIQRGEPASHFLIMTHVLLSLHQQGLLQGQPQAQPNGTLNELQDELESIFRDSATFARFYPGASLDTGLYWLRHPPANYVPIADQVESTVIELIHSQAKIDHGLAVQAVHERCPGLMTPENEVIEACLNAYADQAEDESICWYVRKREAVAPRAKDLLEIQGLIKSIAQKLDYQVSATQDGTYWIDENSNLVYSFFPITTALISPLLLRHANTPGMKLIVIPGSRSNLITYKLKRDPNLQLLCGESWYFIKFRQIRNISNNPLLNRELFLFQIFEDPPEYQSSQLALF
ncbi:MAG: hypothetical protein AB2L21_06865 [Anaerolineaceae bacterium]